MKQFRITKYFITSTQEVIEAETIEEAIEMAENNGYIDKDQAIEGLERVCDGAIYPKNGIYAEEID